MRLYPLCLTVGASWSTAERGIERRRREPLGPETSRFPACLSAERERLQQPYQASRHAQSTASRCELTPAKGYEPEAEDEGNRWVHGFSFRVWAAATAAAD
jgi:hypothetical protein